MRVLLALVLTLWAATTFAQTAAEDRDFLTGLIEDTVSNDNMTVRLGGFAGALSSEATADTITIADRDGVWLQLDDLAITWNRAALLSGRVEIDKLVANRIELIRLPAANAPAMDLPRAEATPFTLPDLPVSVNIASVEATEIILTEALLGEAVTARFAGALSLGGGAGAADITLQRADGKTGTFTVDAAYENTSRQLSLLLLAEEGANGIAARVLNIPDRPAMTLEIAGDAPLDDFAATLALATDGADRVTGTLRLATQPDRQDQDFALDLSGDVRPLLAPGYHPFFGTNALLRLAGTRAGDGGLALSNLTVAADQLVLRGTGTFDAQGWPEALDLTGRLGSGRGDAVQLPVSGAPVLVRDMSLKVDYDAAQGDAWTAAFDITSLTRDGVAIDALALAGGGTLTPGAGAGRGRFTADLDYAARGLALDDAALSTAIGRDINGRLSLARLEGEPFVLRALSLDGAGISAVANALVKGPDDRFWTRANISVKADDFNRFAALSGLDLSGAGAFTASGDIQPFDGIFDVTLDAQTRDLAIGNPQLDPFLTGDTILSLNADRDTTGTRLGRIALDGAMLAAEGSAAITANGASARFNATITDLGRAVPALSGAATVSGTVATDSQGVVTLDTQLAAPQTGVTLQARAVPTADTAGYVVNGQTNATLGNLVPYGNLVGQRLGGSLQAGLTGRFNTVTGAASANVTAQTQGLRAGPAALDPVLAGTGRINADLRLSDAGRLRLDALDLRFPNLTVAGTVASSGADTIADLSLRLADIGLFTPDYSGPVQAGISARQDTQGWQVSGDANGPVGTSATVSGRVGNGGALALNLTGSAPLALANVYIAPRQISGLARFDLAINGPAALSSLRGPVTISDARLTAPTLGQTLENLNGTINLAGGTARMDLRSQSTAGGGVALSGPVDLAPPNQAALIIALSDVVLRDPTLYRTTVAGQIAINGPLAGGAGISGTLDLGAAEVQVPSTGVSALGALPAVTHLGIPTDVRRTLDRAGLGVTAQTTRARASGPAYPLDLLVRAPSRIFVRGRGLDAELGGTLRLTGTSRDIIPIGRFDLIRGRLDILGQRFELSEGYAQLQGDFSPFIRLVATTEARTGTLVSIIVEGPADNIEVRFASTPALPQDEVLSQLLFGRDLASISPLQAVQLASAVGTLAGTAGGGGGVLGDLRQGLDLDALDITTDDNGNAAISAGKYISDNIYTDVVVGSDGTSEINLNLDINRNFTARSTVGSDGETSVGVFFERDY